MGASLYRDAANGHWIAEGAEVVAAILDHPACRVRPPGEPVPAALVGTPAGEIFARLARMTDGVRHAERREAAVNRVAAFGDARVAAAAERFAAELSGLNAETLARALPVRVVASLLGVHDAALDEVTALVGRFARCVFPGGTAEELELGKAAAGRLLQLVNIDQIALMVQTYDATAALILGRDPPAPATRRWLAEPVVIAGQELREGEMVLVKLDTAPFGAGPHACPGRSVAMTIARVARRHLGLSDDGID